MSELAEPVPATELFDVFRARILQRQACPPMAELIPKLTRDAAALRSFQDAEPGTADRRFYNLLKLLDTTTLTPIVLTLLRSEHVSTESRANAFRVLESFLVRRMICGGTTKNYNRLFAALISDVKADIAHADVVLATRLAAETAPANRWPRDDELRTTILTRDMYGQRRQDRLVMILRRVEERLRTMDNKTEQGLATTSNLTLEHLIPQKSEPHWPLDESQNDPQAWRSSHIHKLGNLTLTTGPLNSSLSNGPWHAPLQPKDKRRSLVEHSLLKLNSLLVSRYSEKFTEADVDERGAYLAELIISIWPGPEESKLSDPALNTSSPRSSQRVCRRPLHRIPLRARRRGQMHRHRTQGGKPSANYCVVAWTQARHRTASAAAAICGWMCSRKRPFWPVRCWEGRRPRRTR